MLEVIGEAVMEVDTRRDTASRFFQKENALKKKKELIEMIKNKETKKEKVVKAKEDETKKNIDERNLRVAKVFSKKVKLVEEAHELGRKRNENELAVDSKSLQMRFKKSTKCVRRGKPRKRLEQKKKMTLFFQQAVLPSGF